MGGSNVAIEHRMIIPTLGKVLANTFIFYMFLFRPFGEDNRDRFIW